MGHALYRSAPSEDWTEVELIGQFANGTLILREVGKIWPGLILSGPENVRVPVVTPRGIALLETGAA